MSTAIADLKNNTVEGKNILNSENYEEYIKLNIENPKKDKLIIKKITTNFFRINFIRSVKINEEDVIANNKIVKSMFVEILKSPDGVSIIDRTIK